MQGKTCKEISIGDSANFTKTVSELTGSLLGILTISLYV